jgi:hypothetical protein
LIVQAAPKYDSNAVGFNYRGSTCNVRLQSHLYGWLFYISASYDIRKGASNK